MTAAAEQLHLAQPALGAQIRQLEKELNVALIIRHSRGVSPTEAGRLLYERAKKILREVEDIRTEVKSLGAAKKDSIVLGLSPSIMLLIGADVLLEAKREMPGVFLSLSEERSNVLADALERDQLDVILAYNIGARTGFERQAILEEDFLFVTSPDNAPSAPTIHSINSMKSLIARGVGASVMPFSLAAEELRAGKLVGRKIDRPALTRTLYAVLPAGRQPHAPDGEMMRFVKKLEGRILAALGPYGRALT